MSIIGSDQHQQFNQLEISDIIEARMEEIFDLIIAELNRIGVQDVPGGFVLTGGVANTPGILEIAQIILQNRVRIASPDYIRCKRTTIYNRSRVNKICIQER